MHAPDCRCRRCRQIEEFGYLGAALKAAPLYFVGFLIMAVANYGGDFSNWLLGTRFETVSITRKREYLRTTGKWCPPETKPLLDTPWPKMPPGDEWNRYQYSRHRAEESCRAFKPLQPKPAGWFALPVYWGPSNGLAGGLWCPPTVNLEGDIWLVLRQCKLMDNEQPPKHWRPAEVGPKGDGTRT